MTWHKVLPYIVLVLSWCLGSPMLMSTGRWQQPLTSCGYDVRATGGRLPRWLFQGGRARACNDRTHGHTSRCDVCVLLLLRVLLRAVAGLVSSASDGAHTYIGVPCWVWHGRFCVALASTTTAVVTFLARCRAAVQADKLTLGVDL